MPTGTGFAILAIVFVIAIFAASIGLALAMARRNRRRSNALSELAPKLGLSYMAVNLNIARDLQLGAAVLPMISRSAENVRAENVMTGYSRGMRTAMFDYVYDERDPETGTNSRYQTLAAFACPDVAFPAFTWSRRGVLSGFSKHRKLRLKGEGQWLVFVSPQKKLKPELWSGFLEDAATIASEFFRDSRAAAASSGPR